MRWVVMLGLLCWCASTWADDDIEVYPSKGLQSFLGLDDTSAPTRVQPGRARAIQNVRLGVTADARKRPGLDMIGDWLQITGETPCAMTGLTYAQFSGSTSRIVATCGTRAFRLNGATWTTINASFTGGQNNQVVFTTALSTLIATDNTTVGPQQWDGGAGTTFVPVTFTGLTTPVQAAKVTTFFQNYLIFGNTVEGGTRRPTRVRWSNVGTITTYTDADYVDVDAPAGQELNCIGQLFGDIYLGFTSSLYRMSLVGGSGTFAFSKVSNEVGCVAKNSLQQVTLANNQTGLIFLDTKRRVYFFNGTSPTEISWLIHGTMNALRGDRLQYAVSAVDGEHYYLCYSETGQSANQRCLDYNYLLQEWSWHVYQGLTGLNALAQVIDANSETQVYLGTGDSFVYQLTDTDLDNDVGSGGGVVDAVNTMATGTTSFSQVLYDGDSSFTTSALIGAPIELTGGTASGLTGVVIDNTATGLVVARNFSTTPDATTAYQVGRISAFYRTRWDDFGDASRIKQGIELFAVADADLGSTLDIGYAVDFQSNTATPTASLTPGSGALWGTAVWGTDVWGGGDTVLIGDPGRKIPLNDEGRWWSLEFSEDDRNENFRLHGWEALHKKLGHF